MVRWLCILVSANVVSACSGEARHYLVSAPTVEVAVANGDVRPLDVRDGILYLEAMCDVEADAACGVTVADLCRGAPEVYDQQSFQDSAASTPRTVWLARCEPRDGSQTTAG